MSHAEVCPVCKGMGKIEENGILSRSCHGCGGRGWVELRDENPVIPFPYPVPNPYEPYPYEPYPYPYWYKTTWGTGTASPLPKADIIS